MLIKSFIFVPQNKKKLKIKKEIKNIEVFYELVDFFVFDMCFKPGGH